MSIALTLSAADTWGMHGDVGTGWMILMMVAMVLFWGAIVLGLAWLIRGAWPGSTRPQSAAAARESPVEILDRRFAEGTISTDEYRTRREVLAGGAAPGGIGTEEPPPPGAGGETS